MLGLLGLLAVAGCGSAVGFATQPDRPDGGPVCDDVRMDRGHRILSCAEAVRAAEGSLGLIHPSITSAEFDRDSGEFLMCGVEDAACMARLWARQQTGRVTFGFSTGDTVHVYVELDSGGRAITVAGPPR